MSEKVIVVGLDGVGKTTFCKNLEEQGFKYIKNSVGDGTNKIELAKQAISASDEFENVVFDRCYFPDHLIYNQFVDGGNDSTDLNDWSEVIDMLNERQFYILYMTDSVNQVIKRMSGRGDEYIKPEQLVNIHKAYEELMPKVGKMMAVHKLNIGSGELVTLGVYNEF